MNHPFEIPEKIDRGPARLDLIQSLTGLGLALFTGVHLLLLSSILFGKEAMYYETAFLEGAFLTGWEHGYPFLVVLVAIVIFALFIIHAGVAVRKLPASWKEHKIFRSQMSMLKHRDTNLWYTQAVTGFALFFVGSVHIYVMITHPGEIGPYASSDRVVSEYFWPLYLVLLFAVVPHTAIGLYRLSVKWGIFDGKDPRATRKRLRMVKNVLTVFYLVIGMLSIAAYIKIGLEHRDQAGERYEPQSQSASALPQGENQ